jgi:hypothetical protein
MTDKIIIGKKEDKNTTKEANTICNNDEITKYLSKNRFKQLKKNMKHDNNNPHANPYVRLDKIVSVCSKKDFRIILNKCDIEWEK